MVAFTCGGGGGGIHNFIHYTRLTAVKYDIMARAVTPPAPSSRSNINQIVRTVRPGSSSSRRESPRHRSRHRRRRRCRCQNIRLATTASAASATSADDDRIWVIHSLHRIKSIQKPSRGPAQNPNERQSTHPRSRRTPTRNLNFCGEPYLGKLRQYPRGDS